MAKTSTKTTASKTARKSTRGSTANARTPVKRGGDHDKRIVVITRENPRREGTTQRMRYAVILKCDGKTVGEFLKREGARRTALTYALSQGHVKIK